VIGLPTFTPQESADPSVAVVAMLEGQALNGVAQPRLLLAGPIAANADNSRID